MLKQLITNMSKKLTFKLGKPQKNYEQKGNLQILTTFNSQILVQKMPTTPKNKNSKSNFVFRKNSLCQQFIKQKQQEESFDNPELFQKLRKQIGQNYSSYNQFSNKQQLEKLITPQINSTISSPRQQTKIIPTKSKSNTSLSIKNQLNCSHKYNTNLKQTSSTIQSTIQQKNNQKKHLPSFIKIIKNQCIANNDTLYKKTKTIEEKFNFIGKIGQGKYGKVFLVRQKSTKLIFAMKVIQKQKIVHENLLNQFIRQLKIQSYLNHPNIIDLYGFFHDNSHFYILMQYATDGQLYNFIKNNKITTEKSCSHIAKSLLQTTQYMHQKHIIHRDIKPQNIVVTLGTVKLCDFGWAVYNPGKQLRQTFCGTPLYFAPQFLSENKYDFKVDLWAIGIITFQLLYKTTPFDISSKSQLYKIIKQKIIYPSEPSKEFRNFIEKMLAKNPQERLTSTQFLRMEFIKTHQNYEICQELC